MLQFQLIREERESLESLKKTPGSKAKGFIDKFLGGDGWSSER